MVAATKQLGGSPLFLPARLLTSWWTAAFAKPYAIIPAANTQNRLVTILVKEERDVAPWYLRLYGVGHMVKDHSDSEREKPRCCHMGYSFRLAARVLLYASSQTGWHVPRPLLHKSWSTAGMRNSSMGQPHVGSIRRPIAPWARCSSLVRWVLPEN